MQMFERTGKHILSEGGHAVWCVAFNFVSPQHHDIFAAVSSNTATIYRCLPSGEFQVLQIYVDDDRDEEFFACKWTVDEATGAPLLLLAGKNSILRVLDVAHEKLLWTGRGHGDSINDIAVHPSRPSMVLTASRDHSLRLWNIQTRVTAAVMNGEGGHCNEVLTIDFHQQNPNRLASAGMDACIKIWDMSKVAETLRRSEEWDSAEKTFPTAYITVPLFSTTKVHSGYVDCVRWLGNYILSKSADNCVQQWRPPDGPPPHAPITHVQEFSQEQEAHVWFVRFSLDYHCKMLACGTSKGKTYLWDPHAFMKKPICIMHRGHSKHLTVRQTALDYDGKILLAACDDGTIWRYERRDAKPDSNGRKDASMDEADP